MHPRELPGNEFGELILSAEKNLHAGPPADPGRNWHQSSNEAATTTGADRAGCSLGGMCDVSYPAA